MVNADLIPEAIKRWYFVKDSIKLAKQKAKINPDAAPIFNNVETSKAVQFDPEAEPNRKDDGDTTKRQPKDAIDEKRNKKPQ